MASARSNHTPIKTFPAAKARLLGDMAEVIVDIVDPEKIILFGSQAKGTANAHSDYDFLIVDAKPFGKERSRRKTAAEIAWALSEFLVPTDILLCSPAEVRHWSQSLNHVIACAIREGKILYERPCPSQEFTECRSAGFEGSEKHER